MLVDVLTPAIEYAEGGFPVSERIAADWILPKALPLRACCASVDSDSVKTWYIDGKPPKAGQIFRNPDFARTLRLLQKHGPQGFYSGEIASAIVAKSQALGGTMTLDDLASYKGEWVEPAMVVSALARLSPCRSHPASDGQGTRVTTCVSGEAVLGRSAPKPE